MMVKIQFLPALLALNASVVALLVVLTLLFGRLDRSVQCLWSDCSEFTGVHYPHEDAFVCWSVMPFSLHFDQLFRFIFLALYDNEQ